MHRALVPSTAEPRQHTAAGRSLPSRGVLYDARDKSRSLGFSPGTNFSSPLKSPVFLGRVRAGMLRRHFVIGFRYDRTITAAKGVMTRAARWAICKPASGSELQTQARHKQNTGPQRPTPHPRLKGRSQQSQVRQHLVTTRLEIGPTGNAVKDFESRKNWGSTNSRNMK